MISLFEMELQSLSFINKIIDVNNTAYHKVDYKYALKFGICLYGVYDIVILKLITMREGTCMVYSECILQLI